MHVDVAVCLPQEASTVAVVRGIVTNVLEVVGVAQSCIDDIRLAVSEACTNVLQHAAADDEYEIRVEVDGERCAISVKNSGHGFDAGELAGAMPDPSSPRGRGVAIMRAVMDHVDFRSEPEIGTIVHLVKTLTMVENAPLAQLHAPRPPQDLGGH